MIKTKMGFTRLNRTSGSKTGNLTGFTLIELLVVIVIIGILATLATVTLGSARGKARDARRVSDVKQIQTAMELFYNDAQSYPTVASVTPGSPMFYGTTTYMTKVPYNATPIESNCPSAVVNSSYIYTTQTNGTSYTLLYCLGGATGSISAGTHTATPGSIQNP